MQAFGNVVGPSPSASAEDPPDLAELGRSMVDMPASASVVHAQDGYRPEVMLFVDEEFASTNRSAREGRMPTLAWKPVVRFVSHHYRYTRGPNGPHIVQVGVGVDDPTGTGLGTSAFGRPSAGAVDPSVAEMGESR